MADDFLGVIMGHLLNIEFAPAGQRAGQNNDAHARHAQGVGSGVGRAGKGAGNHANGRETLLFGYYCVMETPRRAGPSISDPMHDGVTLLKQGIHGVFGAGGAEGEFRGVDYLLGLVILLQNPRGPRPGRWLGRGPRG